MVSFQTVVGTIIVQCQTYKTCSFKPTSNYVFHIYYLSHVSFKQRGIFHSFLYLTCFHNYQSSCKNTYLLHNSKYYIKQQKIRQNQCKSCFKCHNTSCFWNLPHCFHFSKSGWRYKIPSCLSKNKMLLLS